MGNYTFLAKNPRFCMQDRKVTIAGNAKKQEEPNMVKSNVINLEHNNLHTSKPQNETPFHQSNLAHSHNLHITSKQKHFELNKPQL